MTISRSGKCEVCRKPVKVRKEFRQTIDMFNPTATPTITKELRDDIIKWREEPVFCEDHK